LDGLHFGKNKIMITERSPVQAAPGNLKSGKGFYFEIVYFEIGADKAEIGFNEPQISRITISASFIKKNNVWVIKETGMTTGDNIIEPPEDAKKSNR
jgi:hypothetical protein